MKKILILLLLTISLSSVAQETGIVFEKDTVLENVLARAKAENKLVFIDCYAVWCGPCKFMDANIFPDEAVGKYHNTHFINLKYDMEQPYGIKVKQKYEVKGYPSYLYLNGDGEVVHRGIGSTPDAASFLELSKSAMDTDNNFKGISSKIEKGDRTAQTISRYLTLNYRAPNTESLLNEHFNLIGHEERFSADSWALFSEHLSNIDSDPFRFLLDHRERYSSLYGKQAVDNKISEAFSVVYTNAPEKYEALKSIDAEIFKNNKLMMDFRTAYSSYQREKGNQGLWNDYQAKANEYLLLADAPTAHLNMVAWNIFENYAQFKDKKALQKAAEWSAKSIAREPDNFSYLDTYAHIQYALGKKKLAIQTQEKAVALARSKQSVDLAELENNLKTFKGKR